jgi:hypothetical protein
MLGMPIEAKFKQGANGRFISLAPTEDDGANEAIRQIRAYEQRRLPPAPTVGEPASEVVEHVREAVRETVRKVKKQIAMARAVEFLKSALMDGPQPQRVIEAMPRDENISERTLKRAKKKARVVSERKGRDYWVWRLGITRSEGGQGE